MKEYKLEQGMGNTWHIYLYSPMQVAWLGTVVTALLAKQVVDMLINSDKLKDKSE